MLLGAQCDALTSFGLIQTILLLSNTSAKQCKTSIVACRLLLTPHCSPSVREQYANLSEDVVAFCESSAQPSAAVIDASLDLIDWQTYGSTSMASSIAAQSQSATPSLGGSQQSTPETVQAWPESSTADPTIAGKLEDLDAFLSYLQNDALQHL